MKRLNGPSASCSKAKHDAQISALGGAVAELREANVELRESVVVTNRAVQMLAASQNEVNGMPTRAVAGLIESQRQTQAEQRETQTQLRETDVRLNALIGMVERLAGGA